MKVKLYPSQLVGVNWPWQFTVHLAKRSKKEALLCGYEPSKGHVGEPMYLSAAPSDNICDDCLMEFGLGVLTSAVPLKEKK